MYLQLSQLANTYIEIYDMSSPVVAAQFDTSGFQKLTSSSTFNTTSAIEEKFDTNALNG